MESQTVEMKKVYTIDEVCRMLGLCRNTLTGLIYSGRIKAVKAGARRWLIPAWAVDEFLLKPHGTIKENLK